MSFKRPDKVRVQDGPTAARASAAAMEGLEQRVLLSLTKIPVLNYHRVFDSVAHGMDLTKMNLADVTKEQLDWQLGEMNRLKFRSISLQNYLDWRTTGATLKNAATGAALAADERPIILTFDDANWTDLHVAAPLLQQKGFVGVAAIPTRDAPTTPFPEYWVNNTSGGRYGNMTWDQVRLLSSKTAVAPGSPSGQPYKWELASHSYFHFHLGDGKYTGANGEEATSPRLFRNTPSDLIEQTTQSKTDLINPAKGNFTPIAFVHPFHDVTRRSLAVAAEQYPLVFGPGYDVTAVNTFIGDPDGAGTADLTNGQLTRIFLDKNSPNSAFTAMLDRAAAPTDFVPPNVSRTDTIANAYIDKTGGIVADGTINADGTDRNDVITIDGSTMSGTIRVPQNTSGSIVDTTMPISQLRNPYGVTTLTAFTSSGLGGNDNITVTANTSLTATVYGKDGDDVITGGPLNDTLYGGYGKDVISGGNGVDHLFGEAHDDTLNGNGHTDHIWGGSGNDSLIGGNGTDSLYGEAGNDILDGRGDGLADRLDGGGDSDGAKDDPSLDILVSIENPYL